MSLHTVRASSHRNPTHIGASSPPRLNISDDAAQRSVDVAHRFLVLRRPPGGPSERDAIDDALAAEQARQKDLLFFDDDDAAAGLPSSSPLLDEGDDASSAAAHRAAAAWTAAARGVAKPHVIFHWLLVARDTGVLCLGSVRALDERSSRRRAVTCSNLLAEHGALMATLTAALQSERAILDRRVQLAAVQVRTAQS